MVFERVAIKVFSPAAIATPVYKVKVYLILIKSPALCGIGNFVPAFLNRYFFLELLSLLMLPKRLKKGLIFMRLSLSKERQLLKNTF